MTFLKVTLQLLLTENLDYPRNAAMPSTGDPKRLPKLTQDQKKLLKHHKGCLKCRCFYVDHDTGNCKNNYPNPYTLSPLTEEAAVAARARHERDANDSVQGIGG